MKKYILIYYLNYYSLFRNRDFNSIIIPKGILVLFFYYSAYLFTLQSPDLIDRILFRLSIDFSIYFFLIIILDIFFRLLFRNVPSFGEILLHIVPLNRWLLFKCYMLKSTFNFFNINWFLIITPSIYLKERLALSFSSLIFILMIPIVIDRFVVFLKVSFQHTWLNVFLFSFIIGGLINFNDFSITTTILFKLQEIKFSWMILLLLLIQFFDFFSTLFWKSWYHRSSKVRKKNFWIITSQKKQFFQNDYILLQLRLIFRNKRIKTMLISTLFLISISAALIFSLDDEFPYFKYYLISCLLGSFGFTVGFYLFSAEINYLPFIHVSGLRYTSYILSKYWLLNCFSLSFGILFMPFLNSQNILLFISNLALIISVCNPIILFIGIFYSTKLNLMESSFVNGQGTNFLQLLYGTVLSFVPSVIFFLANQLYLGFLPIMFLIILGSFIITSKYSFTFNKLRWLLIKIKYKKMP